MYAAALGWTDLSTRQRHGLENAFKAKGGLVVRLLALHSSFLIGHVARSVSHSSPDCVSLTMLLIAPSVEM